MLSLPDFEGHSSCPTIIISSWYETGCCEIEHTFDVNSTGLQHGLWWGFAVAKFFNSLNCLGNFGLWEHRVSPAAKGLWSHLFWLCYWLSYQVKVLNQEQDKSLGNTQLLKCYLSWLELQYNILVVQVSVLIIFSQHYWNNL